MVLSPLTLKTPRSESHGLIRPDLRSVNPWKSSRKTTILTPAEVWSFMRIFMATVWMITGRRGAGKTYLETVLALFQSMRIKAYEQRMNIKSPFKIMSNYHIEFADFWHPEIMEMLLDYPDWGKHIFLCVDEIQTEANRRRPMSGHNVGIGALLTMIRKMKIDCVFTTQFPQTIDPLLLLQVDLFVDVETSRDKRIIKLKFHDYWGQYTGRNYRKPWPPNLNPPDEVRYLYVPEPSAVFDLYNSDDVIAPKFLGDELRAKMSGDLMDKYGRELMDIPEGERAQLTEPDETQAAELEDPRTMGNFIATLPEGQSFIVKNTYTKAALIEPNMSYQDYVDYLKKNGFEITVKSKKYFAKRKEQ